MRKIDPQSGCTKSLPAKRSCTSYRTATHRTVKEVFLACHSTKNAGNLLYFPVNRSNERQAHQHLFQELTLGNQGQSLFFLHFRKMIKPNRIASQKSLFLRLIKDIIKLDKIKALAVCEVDHRARPVRSPHQFFYTDRIQLPP